MTDERHRGARDRAGGPAPSAAAPSPGDTVARTPPSPVSTDERAGPLPRGTAIHRYIVDEVVGAGAMGVVYMAHDRELNRRVALKLVRDPRRGLARQRLLREAQALAQLSHPNVVTIFDVGSHGEEVFVAMEYVAGRTLRQWLAERSRSRDEIVDVYRAAAQGLAAAHAAGIVHRDFKPDNVLIDDRGRVRVADFGLASVERGDEQAPAECSTDEPERHRSGSGDDLTATGAVLGTPAYMAPEQRSGRASVDARADQFSFCVALYEALCGQRPYEVADTVQVGDGSPVAPPAPRGVSPGIPGVPEVTSALAGGEATALASTLASPSAPTAAGPDHPAFYPAPPTGGAVPVRKLPARLRRLLARGLCLGPDDRYPSMGALLADLGIGRVRRRRRWLAAAVGVGLAALALALPWSRRSAETPPCRSAAEHMVGVWDAAKAGAVRAAFAASGSPHAAGAHAQLAGALDRWTGAWIAERTAACETARHGDEPSGALLDLRMECLDRHRHEVAALVALFAGGGENMVAEAETASQSLPSLEDCSARALTGSMPAPTDPALRERVETLERKLARVQAKNDAGRGASALSEIGPITEQAAALGHRPLEARALQALAEAEREAGHLEAYEDALYRAIAAADAGREARLAAEGWIDLADLVGVRGGRRLDGERIVQQARAALDRLGGDLALEAQLEMVLGDRALAASDPEGARRHLNRAVELNSSTYGPDSFLQAEPLQRLAELESSEDRPSEALRLYRRAHDLVAVRLGSDHPDAIALLLGQASALHELGQLDEALALDKRGLAEAERVLGPDNPLASYFLNNAALILQQRGELKEAVAMLQRALTLDVAHIGPDHLDVAPEYFNLGNILAALGRLDEAVPHFEHAIAIYDKLGPSDSLAQSLGGLGETHLVAGRTDRALPYLERSLAMYEAGTGTPAQVGEVRFLLAQALWDSKRDRPRAVRLAVQAREELSRAGASELAGEAATWVRRRR